MKRYFGFLPFLALLIGLSGCGDDKSSNPGSNCGASPLVGTWQRASTENGTTNSEKLEFKSNCEFVLTYCCQGPGCSEQGCTTEDGMKFSDLGDEVRLTGEPGSEVNDVPFEVAGTTLIMYWDEGELSYQRQ